VQHHSGAAFFEHEGCIEHEGSMTARLDRFEPRITLAFSRVCVSARLDVAGQALGGVLGLARFLAQLPRRMSRSVPERSCGLCGCVSWQLV